MLLENSNHVHACMFVCYFVCVFVCLFVPEELLLEGNRLTGSISSALCSSRGLQLGSLSVLKADCDIACDCCDFMQGCDRIPSG
jgi:hypothetical protein